MSALIIKPLLLTILLYGPRIDSPALQYQPCVLSEQSQPLMHLA